MHLHKFYLKKIIQIKLIKNLNQQKNIITNLKRYNKNKTSNNYIFIT